MPVVTVPHIHLLLNHVPTVGSVVALGLFLLSAIRRSDHLRQASYEVFFLVALATIPAYLTGVTAQTSIVDRPGVSAEAIAAHHDWALMAFIVMEIAGFVAWVALWHSRRFGGSAAWAPAAILLPAAVLLLEVLTVALMAQAANVGGEIRHPEISAIEGVIRSGGLINAQSIQQFTKDNAWVWPACETLHFIGLNLLLGVLIFVNVRLLGAFRPISFASLHRLLPWAMLGLAVNVATGLVFVITYPRQYETLAFSSKIVCLMVAGADLLYLTVADKPWAVHAGDDAVRLDKAIAALAIVAWIAVTYLGRMLPYLGVS